MGGDKKVDEKTLQKAYRLLIEAVYAKWNPEKFDDVPGLMEKYEDQEGEIYDRIVRKYVFCQPRKDWQPLIEAMYAHFNPSKLTNLESIFEKYTDSEAALYRALCDKYLPTLKDTASLVYNVWGQPGEDKPVEEEASAEEADEEPPMQLASPSQEQVPEQEQEQEEVPMQLASPSPEKEQEHEASQPIAKNMQEASPPRAASARELQPGAGDEPLPVAAAAKEGRKRKRRVQIAEDGSKVVVDREKGDRKRRRSEIETVQVAGDARPPAIPVRTRVDAPTGDAPPPLPRRRKKDREAQTGAGDSVAVRDDFWQPQAAESQRSQDNLMTKPKAAGLRPPEVTCFEHDMEAGNQTQRVKRRRVKPSDDQNGDAAVDGTAGNDKDGTRRRKRRRRVPVVDAAEAVAATAPATEQAGPMQTGQPPVPLATAQVPVLDSERRQQLMQKLSALKTQLAQQPRCMPEQQRENTESGTYSDYSDEDDMPQGAQVPHNEGQGGAVHLRNAQEAALRAQLLQSKMSTLRKATGNVEPT